MTPRLARTSDIEALAQLRYALWPLGSVAEFRSEVAQIVAGTFSPLPYVILVADDDDTLVGFIEVSLRSHADGCESHPVGFIEGWYVAKAFRGRGVGRSLALSAEDWAREHGCTEMGSDALLDNVESQRAHAALGYSVVDRCVNYRKTLSNSTV